MTSVEDPTFNALKIFILRVNGSKDTLVKVMTIVIMQSIHILCGTSLSIKRTIRYQKLHVTISQLRPLVAKSTFNRKPI